MVSSFKNIALIFPEIPFVQFLPLFSCSISTSSVISTDSRKTLEQKFIFQIGTLNPDGINERFSLN